MGIAPPYKSRAEAQSPGWPASASELGMNEVRARGRLVIGSYRQGSEATVKTGLGIRILSTTSPLPAYVIKLTVSAYLSFNILVLSRDNN